ncbi:hypothetical protein QR680_013222 [Steinernema hermaphroditum]|uniref:Uncharacterized protein n=1 Tax=Steinernema hermaphroditum TaxID=289476 RepID=A0AA39I7C9_9BILA|nr:hypothetical protein QR680_013222 [Steinernema hermaphroditum]
MSRATRHATTNRSNGPLGAEPSSRQERRSRQHLVSACLPALTVPPLLCVGRSVSLHPNKMLQVLIVCYLLSEIYRLYNAPKFDPVKKEVVVGAPQTPAVPAMSTAPPTPVVSTVAI